MLSRIRLWQWSVIAIVLGAAIAAFFIWRTRSRTYDAAHLLQTLPLNRAVKIYIDAGALRTGGLLDLLAGSRAAEEADYRRFLEQTHFDYRTDLDAVAAAFVDSGVFFAVQGRFDWKRLQAYAKSEQGKCDDSICSMPASQPNRIISFYRLGDRVLALAVTALENGVRDISPAGRAAPNFVPSAPVWISAPGSAFRDLSALPAGSKILSPLAESQEAAFSVRALSKDHFEIRLDAAYDSPAIAQKAAQQLTSTTNLLVSMMRRDKLTPNSTDLSGPLSAGKFEVQASHVLGTWPLERKFFEAQLANKKP